MRLTPLPLEGTMHRLAALVRAARVTTKATSSACDIEKAKLSETKGQADEARSGAGELFAPIAFASAARPPAQAGALLPNLQWPAGEYWLPLLTEAEPYRVWDVTTSNYHKKQTAMVPCGHLCLVSQGHGNISIMIVGGEGGQSSAANDAREITILIRATAGLWQCGV